MGGKEINVEKGGYKGVMEFMQHKNRNRNCVSEEMASATEKEKRAVWETMNRISVWLLCKMAS